jgi:hypothetical protein
MNRHVLAAVSDRYFMLKKSRHYLSDHSGRRMSSMSLPEPAERQLRFATIERHNPPGDFA